MNLENEDYQFYKLGFVSKEVSDQPKYFNMMLKKIPYLTWKYDL